MNPWKLIENEWHHLLFFTLLISFIGAGASGAQTLMNGKISWYATVSSWSFAIFFVLVGIFVDIGVTIPRQKVVAVIYWLLGMFIFYMIIEMAAKSLSGWFLPKNYFYFFAPLNALIFALLLLTRKTEEKEKNS